MKKRIILTSILSVAGLAGTMGVVSLAGASAAPNAVGLSNVSYKTTTANAKESVKPETPEAKNSAEADGPGGHQDANGVNTDHQFQGNE